MEKGTVYLFSIYRFSKKDVEDMRPSDLEENATGIMTMRELESHWNNKKNGGTTMDIDKYWVRIL